MAAAPGEQLEDHMVKKALRGWVLMAMLMASAACAPAGSTWSNGPLA